MGRRCNDPIELFFDRMDAAQLLVPTPLQLTGNNPILWVYGIVLPVCTRGLVARRLNGILKLTPLLGLLLILRRKCGQSGRASCRERV